jgi:hydrogenase expression/formation protein HypE
VSDARETRVLQLIDRARAKPRRFRDERITMAHGAGGKATRALVEGMLLPALQSPALDALDDAAVLELDGTRLAFTTDTFVVRPTVFPGGTIGELAVNGTVNDLAVTGARPVALSLSLVLEEGLAADDLKLQVDSIAAAAAAAGVEIVAGDTKVVERGHADELYIGTTGIGLLDTRAELATESIAPDDRVLVSGPIAEHGTTIMLARDELGLDADVRSDTCSLWPAADALLEAAGPALRCMRDATRGGVATVLNEFARAAGVGVLVDEQSVPVAPPVAAACELLGIDPMHVANEGRLVAVVAADGAGAALAALRAVAGCDAAAEIARVTADPPGMVLVQTGFGGQRVMDMLTGDPLPRIC